MTPTAPAATDHREHAAGLLVLVEHVAEAVRQVGIDGALLAVERTIRRDSRCWPVAVCPDGSALHLFAIVARAAHGVSGVGEPDRELQ